MRNTSALGIGWTDQTAARGISDDPEPPSAVFQRWRPTAVFETFWKFAAERQAIFWRRLAGKLLPWTTDPVLSTYRFTNTYRASDRVSQFLIREVIYKGDQSTREVFFRTILFKLFNKIDTWMLITRSLGELTSSIPMEKVDAILTRAMAAGVKIYSGAYIMPSGAGELRMAHKHRAHLLLLEQMLKDEVPEKIVDCGCMADAFTILRSYPMVGDFLAYQYVIDLNYSLLTNFSESEFVVPGPGAKSGLRKCFQAVEPSNEAQIIRAVAECQEIEFQSLDLTFKYLGTRRLQLIDCQNLFCEIDKYARVVHPDIRTRANRTKIKRRFVPHPETIDYWYPPKWGINESLKHDSNPTFHE